MTFNCLTRRAWTDVWELSSVESLSLSKVDQFANFRLYFHYIVLAKSYLLVVASVFILLILRHRWKDSYDVVLVDVRL